MVRVYIERVYNIKVSKIHEINLDDIDADKCIKKINNGIIPKGLTDIMGAEELDETEDLERIIDVCNEFGSDLNIINDGTMYEKTFVHIDLDKDSKMSESIDECEANSDSESDDDSSDDSSSDDE